MDFNVDKQQLSSCRVIREAKAEQSVDCDITLPDYCRDIKSVLCCSVIPGITGVDITGNRITAMGNAVIRLLYVGDNDQISCFEQNYPISKYVEMGGLPQEAAILVNGKTSYVNCRAVSPRRVDVHGCVNIIFSAVCCETNEIICAADSDGLQLKQEPFKTCCAIGCTSKLFEMSEVIALAEQSCKPNGLIYANAQPNITEVKTVSNKVLLKGDLQLTALLCCENGGTQKVEQTLPISRIVELDGLSENSICDIRVELSSMDAQLKPDESGEAGRLDVAVTLCATVYGYKDVECACVLDAYSLKNEVELTRGTALQESLAADLNETFVLSSALDFSNNPAAKVYDFWCGDLTCVSSFENGALELSGAVTVNVLYADSENKPCFAKHRVDYRHAKDIADAASVRYEPNIAVTGVAVSGSGKELNARVQFSARGCVFAQSNRLAVTEMSAAPSINTGEATPAITVYFADSGEAVWDIAKKYSTTVDAICSRNSLTADKINAKTMLIIPKA